MRAAERMARRGGMNSVRAFTLVGLMGAMLSGCATSADNLARVRPGMSESQVVAALGRPYAATVQDDARVLHYRLADRPFMAGKYDFPGYYFVTLRGDRVIKTGSDPQAAASRDSRPIVINAPVYQPAQFQPARMPQTRTYHVENEGFGNVRVTPY